ncbi:MAG: hypothetical protein PHY73_06615 [Candidatus Omnitrophica bacterium]|nr:hypothetical protein [Candidatus Omnitrophota bacterium]
MSIKKFLIIFVLFVVSGCAFTQEEYDLQEKYNKKRQEVREAEKKDSLTVRW